MMNNKVFPEFRKASRMSNNDSLSIHWGYDVRPDGFIKRSRFVPGENKSTEPVFIINDFLPPHKDIPSYSAVTRSIHNKDSFHRAMGPIILVGQLFGLFPVCGIMGKSASNINFKWVSFRVFYSTLYLIGGFTLLSLCFARMFRFGFNISSASMVVFYGSTFLAAVIFFRISRRWPMLSRAIEKEEARSAPYFTNEKRTTLVIKLRLCAFLILFSALVEHVLSIISGLAMVYGCDHDNPLFVGFYTSSFPQIFSFTSYALWKAILLQIYNFGATFSWNFMDLFIILMSIALASRFDKLNQCVTAVRGKNLPEHFWKVTRNEYANLAHLVTLVDENINELILLSFANNLYIICLQLFNSFDSTHDETSVNIPCWKKLYNGIFTSIYFLFSFAFLISRFFTVSMSASGIYTNSRVPLNTLFSVSSEAYCVEIQRFIDHITSDVVAFTGMKFFHVTRGLILTIAGTVVTYELVLVQFNAPPPSVQANITLKENHCGTIDPIKPVD